jgi:D-aspartate ligase
MNIQEHKFILLASYTGNTLGQIRSLGEKGIKPITVLVHKNTFRIDKSKYIGKLYNVKSIDEGIDLIIEKFGNEPNKPFLFTDRDDVMGLIDRRYNELISKFNIWNAGQQGRLSKYLNKGEQIKLAERCGFKVPKTEMVKLGDMPHSLRYPIFTKATDSLNEWWKGCASICKNEKELKDFCKKLEVDNLIIQEYIDKKDETPIEGISINGGKDILLFGLTKNYRMTADSFGTFRRIEPFNDKSIEDSIRRFIQQINYTGAFEIELIIDKEGNAYFLEANFRIAQQNYGYTAFGANIPYIYALSVLKGEIAKEEIHYTNKSPFRMMYEFEDFRLSVLGKKISLWHWLKDIKQTDVFLFYNKKDKTPFYYTLWEKTRKII